MNQNKLTFQSEGLTVDYISFNITGFMDPASMNKLASYFSELFGFNSTFGKGNVAKSKEEIIFYDAKTHIKFVSSSWNTIHLRKVFGKGQKLTSLEKMLLIFTILLKLKDLIGVFLS